MLATAIDALTRPGEFFARRPDPTLRWPALFVVGSGLVNATTGIAIVSEFRHLMADGELATAAGFGLVVLPAAALLWWVLVTGLLYGLSKRLAGGASFRRLLAHVGWGWLPQLLAALVVFLATVVVVSQLRPPPHEGSVPAFVRRLAGDPLVAFTAAAGIARTTTAGSLTQVKFAVSAVGALWTGYVWVAAAERSAGLTRRQALLAVGVPVALMLLNVVAGVFGVNLRA